MRPLTNVIYELNLINIEGSEIKETFSHDFDSEIYNSDVEGTDLMMVNFRVQDLREIYGELFLMEFTVDRGDVLQ